MEDTLERKLSLFCEMIPNTENISNPNDIRRLNEILIECVKTNQEFPFEEIENRIGQRTFANPSNNSIDAFMESLRTYVAKYKPGVDLIFEK